MSTLTEILAEYKLEGKTKFQGLDIAIENQKGSVRRGTSELGEKWETEMKYPYGYIVGSKGLDGAPLDCYIGPEKGAKFAYVVHQLHPDTGEWDEDKVMLGFQDAMEAKQAYLMHYDRDDFFGTMDTIPMARFKELAFQAKKQPIKICGQEEAPPVSNKTPGGLKVGMPVTVDGFHGRGVITRVAGRRVRIRFWNTETVERDEMFVHPFTENEVNKTFRDSHYRDDGAQVKAAKEWTELEEGGPVERRRGPGMFIVQQGTQFCVKSNGIDRNLGCYPSRAQAEAVMQGKSFTELEAGGPGSGPTAPCPQCGPHSGRHAPLHNYRRGSGVTRVYDLLKSGRKVPMSEFRQTAGDRAEELMATLRRHGRENGNWRIVTGYQPGGRYIQLVKTDTSRQHLLHNPTQTPNLPPENARPWRPEMTTPTAPAPAAQPVKVPTALDERPPKGFMKKDFKDEDTTVSKLSEAGIGISQDEVRDFERDFQMSPQDYKAALFRGVEDQLPGLQVSISRGFAGSWDIRARADDGVRMTRNIDVRNGTASHEYWTMGTKGDAGIGKKIFANQLDLYDHLGIGRVKIEAGLNVGGYAWARYGFVPNQSSWNYLREDGNEVSQIARREYKTQDPQTYSQIKTITSLPEPKAIWLLAALKDKNGDSVGKKLLLGRHWEGSINLNDKDNYFAVRSYLGRPAFSGAAELDWLMGGKGKDEDAFHRLMLKSQEGARASDRLAVKTAIKLGWSKEEAERLFGGKSIKAMGTVSGLRHSETGVDQKKHKVLYSKLTAAIKKFRTMGSDVDDGLSSLRQLYKQATALLTTAKVTRGDWNEERLGNVDKSIKEAIRWQARNYPNKMRRAINAGFYHLLTAMNLTYSPVDPSDADIHAGGPGSGCNPAVTRCGRRGRGWIGVDFDGTLAKRPKHWVGPTELGKPILPMVKYIRKLIEERGEDVRLFTARAANNNPNELRALRQWMATHIGHVMPITATKDIWLKRILDDSARHVARDKGKILARGIQHFGIVKADKEILNKIGDDWTHGGKLSKRATLLHRAGYLERDGFRFRRTAKGRAAAQGQYVDCGGDKLPGGVVEGFGQSVGQRGSGWSYGFRYPAGYLPTRQLAGLPKAGGRGGRGTAGLYPRSGGGSAGRRFPNQSLGKSKSSAGMRQPNTSLRPHSRLEADFEGEPTAGNMGHAHIDPLVWFHPPSLTKNRKNEDTRVPTDDPREKNDKYLDVTKRDSEDTQRFRMKLLKRQQPPTGMTGIPARTTLIVPHTATYMPSMFDAAADKTIKQRPAKTVGAKRTHVAYNRRGCI